MLEDRLVLVVGITDGLVGLGCGVTSGTALYLRVINTSDSLVGKFTI
jgi:hypothetical protein